MSSPMNVYDCKNLKSIGQTPEKGFSTMPFQQYSKSDISFEAAHMVIRDERTPTKFVTDGPPAMEESKTPRIENHTKKRTNHHHSMRVAPIDETQLPLLPVREQYIQKAKMKSAISTLDSAPTNVHFDLLAKRYGLKSHIRAQQKSSDFTIHTAQSGIAIVKKLPQAVHFLDVSIQNNHMNQQKKMKSQGFMVPKLGEKKQSSASLTPGLVHVQPTLTKYDSEEHFSIKNMQHRDAPPKGIGYIQQSNNNVPKRLQNFEYAAKIYQQEMPSKRQSKGSNRFNPLINKGINGQNNSGEATISQQDITIRSKSPHSPRELKKCNTNVRTKSNKKFGTKNGGSVKANLSTEHIMEVLGGADWLINADVEEKPEAPATDEPSSSTQYDSRAFNEIRRLDHRLAQICSVQGDANAIQNKPQPPFIDALPALSQKDHQQLKNSSEARYNAAPNSGLQKQTNSGIVIARKLNKQLINNATVFNPTQNSASHLKTTKIESRQQRQLSFKNTPVNVYMNSQPTTAARGMADHPSPQSSEQRVHLTRRLEQQASINIKQANHSKKNFKPVLQLSSKMLKQSGASRSNSSQGINSFQSAGKKNINNGVAMIDPKSPYGGERSDKDDTKHFEINTIDLQKMKSNKVKLPTLQNERNQVGPKLTNQRSAIISHNKALEGKASDRVYSQKVKQQSKGMIIQPNFQHIVHDQHSKLSNKKESPAVKMCESSFKQQNFNLHMNDVVEKGIKTFEATSDSNKSLKKDNRRQSSSQIMLDNEFEIIQNSGGLVKNQSALMTKDVESRRQKDDQHEIQRSCDNSLHRDSGNLQMQMPFETPASSQGALVLSNQAITERRKRNNMNIAMSESVRSQIPAIQDSFEGQKTHESSEERVIILDNLNVQDLVRSTNRTTSQEHIKVEESIAIQRKKHRLMVEEQGFVEQRRCDSLQDNYASMEAKMDQKSQEMTIQKRASNKNAIAIYSQQLSPRNQNKNVRNTVQHIIKSRESSQASRKNRGGNNNDLNQQLVFINSLNSKGSRESLKRKATSIDSKRGPTPQIQAKMTTKSKAQNDGLLKALSQAYQGSAKVKKSLVIREKEEQEEKLQSKLEQIQEPRLDHKLIFNRVGGFNTAKQKQTVQHQQVKMRQIVPVLPKSKQASPVLNEQGINVVESIVDLSSKQKDVTPKQMERIASKVSKAKLFDMHRKKLAAQLVEKDNSASNIVAKKRSEQQFQEAKTKGLLRLIDSSTNIAGRADSLESQDLTPPRASLISKQGSTLARKNSTLNQVSQLGRHLSQGDGIGSMSGTKTPSRPKQYRLEDLEQLGVLGRGSFGSVHLVKHSLTGQMFAMKTIQKVMIQGDKHIQHIQNEKQILQDLTDGISRKTREVSFFVNFMETLQDEDNLYLVLEYLPGGELMQQIRQNMSLTMDQSLFYLAEILVAIQQLHQKNIIYRDLKPENILLDREGHIKLIDFGFSKQLADLRRDRVRTNCGTPAYAAPEVLIGAGYNYKADIWSFGILICEMLGGFTPFGPKAMEIGVAQDGFIDDSPSPGGYSNIAPHKMIDLVQTGRIILPKNLTPKTRDLVRKILVADPFVRLDIKDIMQHQFFEGIDWNQVARKLADPPHVPDQANLPVFKSNSALEITQVTATQEKRTAQGNKILGDYHLSKLNSVFENF